MLKHQLAPSNGGKAFCSKQLKYGFSKGGLTHRYENVCCYASSTVSKATTLCEQTLDTLVYQRLQAASRFVTSDQ